MFDLLFIAYVVASILLGFRYGLFRRIMHIGGFYLGLLLAQALSPGISAGLGYSSGTHPSASHFGIYLIIVVSIVVVSEVLGALFADVASAFNSMVFDRAFGVAAGGVFAVFELAALLYLFNGFVQTPLGSGGTQPPIVTNVSEQLGQSFLAKRLDQLQSISTTIYLPVLPGEPRRYFAKTYS
jgi:uncharacterized membrane protein required for colicin V production